MSGYSAWNSSRMVFSIWSWLASCIQTTILPLGLVAVVGSTTAVAAGGSVLAGAGVAVGAQAASSMVLNSSADKKRMGCGERCMSDSPPAIKAGADRAVGWS